METLLGTIILFGGNFEPRGWASCNGQLLSIQQNAALYSLLGTFYGGDGVTTFALPDLRGRVPIHMGQGPGLTRRSLGEKLGSESVTLQSGQTPAQNADALVAANLPSGPPADGNLPHDNMQPSLCLNYIIALEGIYPSRT